MNSSEKQYEMPFDIKDVDLVNGLKREYKKSLKVDISFCILFSFIMPFLFKQTKLDMINDLPYLFSWMIGLMICIIIWSLKNRTIITYINKYKDFKNDRKMILETKIKEIIHLKSQINISVTNPKYKYINFQVINDRGYSNPSVNDDIELSILPNTKMVLSMRKI